jgi:hypothetical protein
MLHNDMKPKCHFYDFIDAVQYKYNTTGWLHVMI